MAWLKKNLKDILFAASVLINALGGAGIIPPVVTKTGNQVIRTVDTVNGVVNP